MYVACACVGVFVHVGRLTPFPGAVHVVCVCVVSWCVCVCAACACEVVFVYEGRPTPFPGAV